MAINYDELVSKGKQGMEYLYLAPRPGEDTEKYVQRVGITAAKKYAPALVADYVGQATESSLGGLLGGVGTTSALTGLGTYLSTKDVGKAATSAGISGATGLAGNLAAEQFAGTALGSAAPYLGTAVNLGLALSGDATAEQKGKASIQAAQAAGGVGMKAAGFSTPYAAIPGIAMAISENISSNAPSKDHIGLSYDTTTGKFETDWGIGTGNYKESWASLDPALRNKIAMGVKKDAIDKDVEYERYTQGWSDVAKSDLKDTLGDNYFGSRINFTEKDMDRWRDPKWDGDVSMMARGVNMPDSHLGTLELATQLQGEDRTISDLMYEYDKEEQEGTFGTGERDPSKSSKILQEQRSKKGIPTVFDRDQRLKPTALAGTRKDMGDEGI